MPTATPDHIADLNQLLAPLQPALEAVRASVRAITPPTGEMLAGSLGHALETRGKLLRPAIALLTGKAAGLEVGNPALTETAAVAEMIHLATLLHDDVLDEADLRRGRQTVRAIDGNTVSILAGDYLLAQASLKLAKLGNTRLVAIYAQVLADLCDGEVLQLQLKQRLDTGWADYAQKSRLKTACLFSAAAESAGVIAGLPEARIQALRDFGDAYGLAFQLMDDVLDYEADAEALGKPMLADLRQGLINAPVIYALEAEPAMAEPITAVFERVDAGEDVAPEANMQAQLQALREQVIATGALEKTLQRAQAAMDTACTALTEAFPEPSSTEARERLMSLARFAIDRKA